MEQLTAVNGRTLTVKTPMGTLKCTVPLKADVSRNGKVCKLADLVIGDEVRVGGQVANGDYLKVVAVTGSTPTKVESAPEEETSEPVPIPTHPAQPNLPPEEELEPITETEQTGTEEPETEVQPKKTPTRKKK